MEDYRPYLLKMPAVLQKALLKLWACCATKSTSQTINEWNTLPEAIVKSPTSEIFKEQVTNHLRSSWTSVAKPLDLCTHEPFAFYFLTENVVKYFVKVKVSRYLGVCIFYLIVYKLPGSGVLKITLLKTILGVWWCALALSLLKRPGLEEEKYRPWKWAFLDR